MFGSGGNPTLKVGHRARSAASPRGQTRASRKCQAPSTAFCARNPGRGLRQAHALERGDSRSQALLLGTCLMLVVTHLAAWPLAVAWGLAGMVALAFSRRVRARPPRILASAALACACIPLVFEGGAFFLPSALTMAFLSAAPPWLDRSDPPVRRAPPPDPFGLEVKRQSLAVAPSCKAGSQPDPHSSVSKVPGT